MLVAAGVGRYSIVTTTPGLSEMMRTLAFDYGAGERLASIVATVGDPVATMRDPTLLLFALEDACWRAIRADGAQAIIIGGGPLATAARMLAGRFPVPLIEPVPCAVRRVRMLLA